MGAGAEGGRPAVWITGAGSGIGRAMAVAFAAAGFVPVLTARGSEGLEATAAAVAQAGGDCLLRPGDVLDRAAMAAITEEAEAAGRSFAVVCNNAGTNGPNRSWEALDWAEWDRILDLNIKGALAVIAAALPAMRRRGGGTFVHTSSWAGRFHAPRAGVPYGASKHALNSLSASLNDLEGPHGIRSTALCPADVRTPLLARRPGYDPENPALDPEVVARAAVFAATLPPGAAVPEITLTALLRAMPEGAPT
ncbi:SDR family NAD(P)-dependent oxidoreductase [Paracoccus sp. S-4012]|uniref:SDR family oxidoreductase n=1 Tax=Paracoccus sp. S-4012 TaxID=2665648 RepID=UPI0012AEFB89|nr:SDR family oxidoreductase [Paracoccus sp. S-4012]MRX50465.1 SDR family NAD(P)-dependent oxidoreductase [Paracoccus sp. S-4012]